MLHAADPVGRLEGAEQLWKATEADALEAGAPLARILNRYAPARRLAGFSDEAELGFSMATFAKRNLVLRGTVLRAHRELAAAEPGAFGQEEAPDIFAESAAPSPPPLHLGANGFSITDTDLVPPPEEVG